MAACGIGRGATAASRTGPRLMSWLHGMHERLIDAILSARRDRDLAEEIRLHLELETARQIERGHDPATARANALVKFGSPSRVADATRAERGPNHLEGSMQDLHWAFRSLRKHPGFTALALITLALGIGVTTVAFSVLDTVLVRPLPFRDSGRLVLLQEVTAKGTESPPSFPNFIDWRDKARGFDGIVSEMFPFTTTVVVGDEPQRISTMGISKGFFRVLGALPAVGREFTDEENSVGGPFAVMVTHEFWKTQLGGRLPLGSIRYGDRTVPLVGVAPAGFKLVGSADFFFPHEQWPGTCRTCRNYVVVGRLAERSSVASARVAMTTLSKALFATYGEKETQAVNASVTPLHQYLVHDYTVTVTAIFIAAGLVLLIACTNLVSALLARGLTREREVAVRTALGASRGRIIRQIFVESAVLALAGAAIGVVFAVVLEKGVKAVGANLLPRVSEMTIDSRILAFTVALTAVTAFLIGLYPAVRLSGARPGVVIRGASRNPGAHSGGRIWTALIGFEIAVAVILTIGSALMMRTMHNILNNDVGFNPRGLVTALLSPDTLPLPEIERIRAELAGVPGAKGAAFVSGMPLSWGNQSGPLLRPGDQPPRYPGMAGFRVVSSEYFSVLQQPVIRGRAFSSSDVQGQSPVAIITPGIASALWPGEHPIGKQIRTNYLIETWLTVVGVVSEASSWSQPRGSQNEIFVPLAQFPEHARNQLVAVVRTDGDPHALIPAVRSRLRSVAPTLPAKFDTIDDRIARTAADRRFAMYAMLGFAIIAVVLAGIGIYGVMSYAVAARAHEIGVRMALGSTPGGVIRLVLRGAIVMALVGVAAGIGGGWAATRYISSILYGVTRADPLAYAAGIGLLILAALAGAFVPAFRSSRIDPLRAIRGE
jgi:putative ABC transport system permease protein